MDNLARLTAAQQEVREAYQRMQSSLKGGGGADDISDLTAAAQTLALIQDRLRDLERRRTARWPSWCARNRRPWRSSRRRALWKCARNAMIREAPGIHKHRRFDAVHAGTSRMAARRLRMHGGPRSG